MATIVLLITIASMILVALGSYLYHDGRNHKFVGKVHAGLGAVALVVVGAAQAQQSADENYDCTVLGRGCPDYSDGLVANLWRVLWGGILKDIAIEMVLMVAAGLVGFLVALVTVRRPSDGRPVEILPPE